MKTALEHYVHYRQNNIFLLTIFLLLFATIELGAPAHAGMPIMAGELLPETQEDRDRIRLRAQLTRKERLDGNIYGKETPPEGLRYRTDAIGWSYFAHQYDYINAVKEEQYMLENHYYDYNIQAMENAGMTNARDSRNQFVRTFLPQWKLENPRPDPCKDNYSFKCFVRDIQSYFQD